MTKKKIIKPTKTKDAIQKINDEQRAWLLSLINYSKDISNSVMELGSAMASDCIQAQDRARKLADSFGWKQERPWDDFK